MALIKTITSPEGASFEYWKIMKVMVDTVKMSMTASMMPFKDKAARTDGMMPYEGLHRSVTFEYTYADLETTPNILKFVYDKCKVSPTQDQTEKDTPYFSDAVDDI